MRVLSDEALARSAGLGDRNATEALIVRHERWVFNLAIRMLWNRDEALDCTQEIFIRMITKISNFKHKSAFSTWLYRIAVNEVLMWKRKSRAEMGITSFECYGRCLSEMPEDEPSIKNPEQALLIEETKIGCTMGMLLCLSRKQRVVYVLGEIFGISDQVCAEVLDLTPNTFRKQLSRCRAQLGAFLQGNCSLVNPDNPCSCARKTAAFVRLGIVDPENLQFTHDAVERVADVVKVGRRTFDSLIEEGIGTLYRNHPFLSPPDMVSVLRVLIGHDRFRELLDL